MYAHITFEEILARMLDRVPNSMDKREGSIVYNALAPAAAEMQLMYIELDVVMNETFADTATREFLVRRASERGITPSLATKAILKGIFNLDISIGSRFSLQDYNYMATEKISTGVFKLECETEGSAPNNLFGQLVPIQYISGLTSAEITELILQGEDEETTEDLRQRYFDSLEAQNYGGNIADYKARTNSLQGVGGVKVLPTWNGGGTVKLIFVDSSYNKPTTTLVNDIQTQIDPLMNQGLGLGIAPIGHVVTVEGVTESIVNIATTITYQTGWTWADVQISVENAIDEYFLSLKQNWENEENIIVRITQTNTKLLALAGILDIAGTTINTLASNLTIASNSIPVRGVVSG
ncbi:MAG: baseplate J/gp47 family protein [Alkaliphilus sp.]